MKKTKKVRKGYWQVKEKYFLWLIDIRAECKAKWGYEEEVIEIRFRSEGTWVLEVELAIGEVVNWAASTKEIKI